MTERTYDEWRRMRHQLLTKGIKPFRERLAAAPGARESENVVDRRNDFWNWMRAIGTGNIDDTMNTANEQIEDFGRWLDSLGLGQKRKIEGEETNKENRKAGPPGFNPWQWMNPI